MFDLTQLEVVLEIRNPDPDVAKTRKVLSVLRSQLGEIVTKRELMAAWKSLPAGKTAADYAYLAWAIPRFRLMTLAEVISLWPHRQVNVSPDGKRAKCFGLTVEGWQVVCEFTAKAVAEKREILPDRSTEDLTSVPKIGTIQGQEARTQTNGGQAVQSVRATGGRRSKVSAERTERFKWSQ